MRRASLKKTFPNCEFDAIYNYVVRMVYEPDTVPVYKKASEYLYKTYGYKGSESLSIAVITLSATINFTDFEKYGIDPLYAYNEAYRAMIDEESELDSDVTEHLSIARLFLYFFYQKYKDMLDFKALPKFDVSNVIDTLVWNDVYAALSYSCEYTEEDISKATYEDMKNRTELSYGVFILEMMKLIRKHIYDIVYSYVVKRNHRDKVSDIVDDIKVIVENSKDVEIIKMMFNLKKKVEKMR